MPIERAVPAAVGCTVVTFAFGSSSVHWVKQVGLDLRWAALIVLLLCVTVLFVLQVAWSRAEPFALAGWFVLLSALSTTWSVVPSLTLERTVSLGILFVTAFLLATSAASLALIERVLVALLVGAVVVALLGLVLLVVDRARALQPSSIGVPTRFRGIGEDADTTALLFAVVLPIAAWGVARGGRAHRRVAAAAAFLLLAGSIVGALSRGALAGAFVGVGVVALAAPRSWQGRAGYATVALALAGLAFGLMTIPSAPAHAAKPAAVAFERHFVDVEKTYPLEEEVGSALPGFGGRAGDGGRLAAWSGAIGQIAERPVAGYGFGSEDRVFVDRYRGFSGSTAHNTYLGILLQLGGVGLASFLALVLLWLGRAGLAYFRLAERDRLSLVACAGMVAAGLTTAVVQSSLTSVGNIATLSFWIGAFLLAALGDPRSVWPWRPPID